MTTPTTIDRETARRLIVLLNDSAIARNAIAMKKAPTDREWEVFDHIDDGIEHMTAFLRTTTGLAWWQLLQLTNQAPRRSITPFPEW